MNILVYGDSITEGVLTLGGSQKFDTDRNDASVVYSYVLGRLLGAEIGVVGFGYNALTHPGSGGVAPLGAAWNQLWEGVPRSFTTPKPDLIVLNEGTNVRKRTSPTDLTYWLICPCCRRTGVIRRTLAVSGLTSQKT